MAKIVIDPSERWIIVAKTGAGKTEFAKYMLRMVEKHMPVVIVDPKEFWLGKHPQWEEERKKPGTIDKPHLVNEFHPEWRVQVLQIDGDDQEDDRLEKMCNAVLKRQHQSGSGPIMMYFDETEDIATASFVPKHIRRVWKTGRALGLAAWVSTQAPKGIPKIFKSQAEKFVAMQVGDEDVEFVAPLVHAEKEEVAQLGNYEWLFYDTKTMQHAEWHPAVPYQETVHV
jgi:energy-coupling factor transporter ATP-binding protein EcfA2